MDYCRNNLTDAVDTSNIISLFFFFKSTVQHEENESDLCAAVLRKGERS